MTERPAAESCWEFSGSREQVTCRQPSNEKFLFEVCTKDIFLVTEKYKERDSFAHLAKFLMYGTE